MDASVVRVSSFEFTVNVEKGLLSPSPRGNGDVGPGLEGNPGLRSVSLAFENGEEIATGSDAQCVSVALLVIMFAYDTAIAVPLGVELDPRA